MIKINYFNGSYSRANKVSPKDFGQVGKAIIMASNEGWPFPGEPNDMARDAICRVNQELGYKIGLFPVVLDSKGGIDVEGKAYTTEVIFQAVF